MDKIEKIILTLMEQQTTEYVLASSLRRERKKPAWEMVSDSDIEGDNVVFHDRAKGKVF